jgi:O-antigen/teichoic acid export membrane protein
LIKSLKHLTHTVKTHQGFRRYFANTSWMLVEQLLRIVAGLLVGIWVARYLGPNQFGIFSYALAFCSIFAGIAKIGLDGIVIRELINNPKDYDVYLGTSFWLKFLGSLITIGLVSVCTIFTTNDQITNQFIYIITFGLVFQSFEVIDFYFQSLVLSKFVSICRVIQLGLSSIVKIYLVLIKSELIYFVWVTLFDQITLAMCLFLAYKLKKDKGFYHSFNFEIAKSLLTDSWPLMLSAFFTMIYMRIDQVMIKSMLGEYEVGIYSAATRLSEAWYFIPAIITSSFFPAIINARKISQDLYLQRLQRLYTFVIWIAIIISVVITFSSDWLVVVLYGETYRAAGDVLKIHVWTGVFAFLGIAFSRYLLAENLTRLYFYRTILGVFTNVSLNYFLIQEIGIVGVAISALLTQFVTNYLFDIFNTQLHQQFKIKTISIFLPYLVFIKKP